VPEPNLDNYVDFIKTMSVSTKSSAPREETGAGKPTTPIDNNINLVFKGGVYGQGKRNGR
jgi:hypothetical protein